jgi:hypothetical protein
LRTRSAIASQIKMQGGIASSPGTIFKVSDAEIFLFSGIGAAESRRESSCSSNGKDDPVHANGENHGSSEKRLSSASRAKDRLKMMLRWPRHKEKMLKMPKKPEGSSPLDAVETPAPLRQKFTKMTALNGKRTLAVKSSTPSSSATKKKLNTKLIHGIMEAIPQLAPSVQSRSSMLSTPQPLAKLKDICLDDEISMVTPTSGKLKDIVLDNDTADDSSMEEIGLEMPENSTRKHGCGNARLINICFGAQGLTVEDSVSGHQTSKMFKQQGLRVT